MRLQSRVNESEKRDRIEMIKIGLVGGPQG